MNSDIMISGKYFLLEKDNRFPLVLPTGEWQNLTNKDFISPTGCSIYLLSGHSNLYVGSDGDGDRAYGHRNRLKGDYHENSYMQNVAKKYGYDIFYYQPLIEIPNEYVIFRNEIENSYIKLFDTYHNGYNLCEFAGDPPMLGRKHTKETKRKLSESHKGQHSSPATEFKKGIVTWNKGIPHTKEAKEKMSKSHKGYRHSPDTEFKKGQIKYPEARSKKVICLDNGKIFNSAIKASRDLGYNYNYVAQRIKRSGFPWRYLEDYLKENNSNSI